MAENTDKEHSEEQTSAHSENTSNEIITKKDPLTINPNQETENV